MNQSLAIMTLAPPQSSQKPLTLTKTTCIYKSLYHLNWPRKNSHSLTKVWTSSHMRWLRSKTLQTMWWMTFMATINNDFSKAIYKVLYQSLSCLIATGEEQKTEIFSCRNKALFKSLLQGGIVKRCLTKNYSHLYLLENTSSNQMSSNLARNRNQ